MAFRLALAALMAAAGIAAGTPALADGAAAPPPIDGVWQNPKNTVHVEIRPCGAAACGYVVWASEKAQADARHGGAKVLVGLQLFRDFAREASGAWRGKVFVPDLNATFTGTAELVDAGTLRAKGCLIANIACKSQIWIRIESAAG